MSEMESVGVREFRDHATAYLSGSKPVAVSKHGHVIGFYIPVDRDDEQVARALDRLDATVHGILTESGMSEDELAEQFDLRRRQPE